MASTIHNPVYRELVERLVAARLAAGLTQHAVAVSLEKPQSYVAKVETLERRVDVIEFMVLAHAIGFDPIRGLKRAWADFSKATTSK